MWWIRTWDWKNLPCTMIVRPTWLAAAHSSRSVSSHKYLCTSLPCQNVSLLCVTENRKYHVQKIKNHLLRLCKMILGRFYWTNCALRIDTRFLRCNISELLLEPVSSIPGSNHGRKQGSRRAIFSLNYFLRYSTLTSYWRQSAKFY